MRETIELILRTMLDNGDAVEVREVERESGTVLLEVQVAESDIGRLIGRQGRTIRALRSLAHAAGIKRNRRFVLEIIE